jgi:hypothetical protein
MFLFVFSKTNMSSTVTCHLCGKTGNFNLGRHVRYHALDERKHRCGFCNQSFKTKAHLDQHFAACVKGTGYQKENIKPPEPNNVDFVPPLKRQNALPLRLTTQQAVGQPRRASSPIPIPIPKLQRQNGVMLPVDYDDELDLDLEYVAGIFKELNIPMTTLGADAVAEEDVDLKDFEDKCSLETKAAAETRSYVEEWVTALHNAPPNFDFSSSDV